MRVKPALLACLAGAPALLAAPAAPHAVMPTFLQPHKAPGPATDSTMRIHLATEAILDRLQSEPNGGNFTQAIDDLQAVLDSVIASYPATDAAAFRAADLPLRMVRQLAAHHKAARLDTLRFLRQSPNLAPDLAFLIKPGDDLPKVFALLDRLRAAHPNDLEKFAPLAAAICVVHEKPYVQHVNQNTARSPDPLELFDYFSANEASMAFGIHDLPAEVLLHIVNAAASIDDLNWARERYHADRNLSNRYKEIRYDIEHLRRGTPMKSDVAGWSLRSIQKNGGICADQAYFASTVGKALGIPTAVITGTSAEAAHAWIGYLKSSGAHAVWDFETGRYDQFQAVRGELLDPQTGRPMADSELAVLSESLHQDPAVRQESQAFVDAAARLADLQKHDPPLNSLPNLHPDKPIKPRTPAPDFELELIDAAVKKSPYNPAAWGALRDAARAGKLTLADKTRWSNTLYNLCGRAYPDFSLQILIPMIQTVENPHDQDALWNSAMSTYRSRPDLAAQIRLLQGALWDKAADRAKAWAAYQDVIDHYAKAGPYLVEATRRQESLLKAAKKDSDILPLYEHVWKSTTRPAGESLEFAQASSWFQIGILYAQRLDSAGRTKDADKVKATLGVQ
jgi:hypothetical protein